MTVLPRTPEPVGPRPRTPLVLVLVAVTLGMTMLAALSTGVSALSAALEATPRLLDTATLAVGAGALIVVVVAVIRRASSARRRSAALLEGE